MRDVCVVVRPVNVVTAVTAQRLDWGGGRRGVGWRTCCELGEWRFSPFSTEKDLLHILDTVGGWKGRRQLAIHLSIGQAYAFSVFKILPLSQLIEVSKPATGDWKQTQIAWIFSFAIVMLGLSAAAFW